MKRTEETDQLKLLLARVQKLGKEGATFSQVMDTLKKELAKITSRK